MTLPAEVIARALQGRQSGGSWQARCPSHDDSQGDVASDQRSMGLWPDYGQRREARRLGLQS